MSPTMPERRPERSPADRRPAVGRERIAYEYAWLRAVPSVHLQTFTPLGVVLFARTADFLALRMHLDEAALIERWPFLDVDLLARRLEACRLVCEGGPAGGPVGLLPPSERFHWLTTPRSAVLQPSRVRGGLTYDPAEALDRLFDCGITR
jgi:hypothetical protein